MRVMPRRLIIVLVPVMIAIVIVTLHWPEVRRRQQPSFEGFHIGHNKIVPGNVNVRIGDQITLSIDRLNCDDVPEGGHKLIGSLLIRKYYDGCTYNGLSWAQVEEFKQAEKEDRR